MAFLDYVNPFGKKNPLKGVQSGMKDFWLGTPEKRKNVSLLRDEQEPLYQQLVNAGMQQGAGGAFGGAADYYRNLLSDESGDFNAFAAPQMRQYYQDIVPQLAEEFAKMGAGGLSSSGFNNSLAQSGVDLAERLGAIRANLRQAGAQGLSGIGQLGLQNYSQNMVTKQGSPGFLGSVAPAIGTGIGAAFGGPIGGAIGGGVGNSFGSWFGSQANSAGANRGPYESSNIPASPRF